MKLLNITHKATDEVHRLPEILADELIGTKPVNGKTFQPTTKNKFRSFMKDMAKLSTAEQANVRKQFLLQY